MNTKVRLNLYERGIVDSLVTDFGYGAAEARKLVVRYISVIRKLGGYDSCFDHAERLVEAERSGYTPEAWMDRLRLIDKDAARDEGIVHLESLEQLHAR